jgi:hypothetical protein
MDDHCSVVKASLNPDRNPDDQYRSEVPAGARTCSRPFSVASSRAL